MPRARPPHRHDVASWPGVHYLGVDENGMGPRLGPLVVTSILARSEPGGRGAEVAIGKARGALAKRIGDSKKLVAFEDSALGEAWARAILRFRPPPSPTPTTPTELLSALALDSDEALRSPCPSQHADLCWGDAGEAFASTEAEVVRCTKDLDRLALKGLTVLEVRVGIVCVRRLNEAVDAGLSRFDVDLHMMERLTLAARERAAEDVYALCGKVGGFDFYGDRFGPLGGRLHTTIVEGRAWSEYRLPGVGHLAFVRDADESHLIVGLASLVGKWVRDHLMRRVVRWHQHRLPAADIPEASGYHDPITTRFVKATALVRKKHKVTESCFERSSLTKKEAEASARGI